MSEATPLFAEHERLNAKMTDFAGYRMPVQYTGIVQEHQAVRECAGLFDVSHMAEIQVSGPKAKEFLQWVTVNDPARLYPGKAQYTMMCREDGGILDDLLLYCLNEELYMLVVNASNRKKIWDHLVSHARDRFQQAVDLADRSDQTALIAIQGPASEKILSSLVSFPSHSRSLSSISSFSFQVGRVAGETGVLVSTTGYTGEDGFELYIDTERSHPATIWQALLEAGKSEGLLPAGLGARDTLRLEAGLPLYGNDLNEDRTPIQAGLGWVVKLDRDPFIGSEALEKEKKSGPDRKLIGFETGDPKQIPRAGYPLLDESDREIGRVTSGTASPTLGSGIGMGYLPADRCVAGETIRIGIRKRIVEATITPLPFYKKSTQ
ncbi:MAG: glycine cleavage system aminomethyltransferase GcvT [Balneolaceae bacterium]